MNISNVNDLKAALDLLNLDAFTPITNTTWRQHRGITDVSVASKELQSLVKAGHLRIEGKKRGTKYFVV